MAESRPVAMPMAMNLDNRHPEEETCNPTLPQSMLGTLMYVVITTRPAIAYAIGVISRDNHDPSNEHMVALTRVFRYLNDTKDWPLRFGGALGGALEGALGESTLRGDGDGALRCSVDLDYAGYPDDDKSTSGLENIFGGAVDWRLRKQNSTSQSTTHSEYYAFGVRCVRLTQTSHRLHELGIPTIPHVFYDSQSLIASIKNRTYSGTAVAHSATKYYLAADMARDGEIHLSYMPTAEMLADCFTKSPPQPPFLKQCAAMGRIGIGLVNGLANGLDIIGNCLRNGHGYCLGIRIGYGVRNAVRKQSD